MHVHIQFNIAILKILKTLNSNIEILILREVPNIGYMPWKYVWNSSEAQRQIQFQHFYVKNSHLYECLTVTTSPCFTFEPPAHVWFCQELRFKGLRNHARMREMSWREKGRHEMSVYDKYWFYRDTVYCK